MKIDNTVGTYSKGSVLTGATSGSATADVISSSLSINSVAAPKSQSASVSLSGKSIMLSRLFHTQDSDAQPSVISASSGLTRDNLSQDPVGFLTDQDRSLVSDMYAYAQEQGSDLTYVDTFATTLGTYRQFDDGKNLGGFNENQVDSEGHQLSSSYNASDTSSANQILSGEAIKSTRVDKGFLNYILQPTHALSNMANVDFMKQMVTKFSDQGTDATSLDSKFKTFTRKDSASSNVVISVSKEVTNQPQTSQIANINGKWFILDPALLKNLSSLKDSGLDSSQIADAKQNAGVVALALLNSDPKKTNDVTAKLLDLLNNSSQPLVL